MNTITVTEQLAAPVEEVFAAFTDLEQGPQHVSGIRAIALLTPGDFGLGTRWQETREVLGVVDSAEMEVTSFQKNKGYTITHHKSAARIDTTFRFEPSETGTLVTLEFDMRGPGLPPGLLAPVSWAIAGKVREVLSRDLSDLKQAVEQAD